MGQRKTYLPVGRGTTPIWSPLVAVRPVTARPSRHFRRLGDPGGLGRCLHSSNGHCVVACRHAAATPFRRLIGRGKLAHCFGTSVLLRRIFGTVRGRRPAELCRYADRPGDSGRAGMRRGRWPPSRGDRTQGPARPGGWRCENGDDSEKRRLSWLASRGGRGRAIGV